MSRWILVLLVFIMNEAVMGADAAARLPTFDFTTAQAYHDWGTAHDASLVQTVEGLAVTITGPDPYFSGPSRDYPETEDLWMVLELKSDFAGTAQVFYFQTGPAEERSARFYVPGGDWTQVKVPLPALGRRTRLRIDPPGTQGRCILRRITFELRPQLKQPTWRPPAPVVLTESASALLSGHLLVRQSPDSFGAFAIEVDQSMMAIGHTRLPIGYVERGAVTWLELTNRPVISRAGDRLSARTDLVDPHGGKWTFERSFRSKDNGIAIESSFTIDADREVCLVPMFMMFPGVGSYGTNKHQAVFAGVEYLENEPSSSEADVIGAGALRRVPDDLKITFPLMTIAAGKRYLALTWEKSPQFAALFDSPDRVFGSGGHLMSLVLPGSSPDIRGDGQVLPYRGRVVRRGEVVKLAAMILGGGGTTVLPALQDYARIHGFPPLPLPGRFKTDYFRLAAHGWLDSEIRDGSRFRHAVGPNFGSQPAADATLLMEWLSGKVDDPDLSLRLATLSAEALKQLSAARYNSEAVGHVRLPVATLVFGSVLENVRTAVREGRDALTHFQPDGSVLLKESDNANDLGKTHWSREANGLAASQVCIVLERAAFSGDPLLLQEGIRLVHALDKFGNTVPRGAQTWEMPLHTPDILASGHLVHAYTLAYELTGEQSLLDQARYWAWTGIPFLYLSPPTDQPVGLYSTIAVLGATQWVAPLWIGLPVQWCGLVYGHAIRRLGRFDSSAPWVKISDGIALAGVQHTHPISDRAAQGLLPDSFDLRNQSRNPVPINPATLLVDALETYGEEPLYDFAAFRSSGVFAHAAGRIVVGAQTRNSVTFNVRPWKPSWLLLSGIHTLPAVTLNGEKLNLSTQAELDESGGWLVLKLSGPSEITLELPPRP